MEFRESSENDLFDYPTDLSETVHLHLWHCMQKTDMRLEMLQGRFSSAGSIRFPSYKDDELTSWGILREVDFQLLKTPA